MYFVFAILVYGFIACIIIYMIRQFLYIRKLTNMIARFQYDLNDQKVIQFMEVLRARRNIPNSPTYWDTLRAGFEMVANSGNVSVEVKNELRNALLSKGVNRLIKIPRKSS